MTGQVRPEDAAQALAAIDRRQSQVVEVALVAGWYWWAVAALMIGLSVVVDAGRRQPVVIGVAAAVFVVGVLAVTAGMVLAARRRVQWRRELVGERAALAIVTLVGLVVGVTLAVAFTLQGVGVAYPATVAGVVGGVVLICGGAVLTRVLRALMRAAARSGRAGSGQ